MKIKKMTSIKIKSGMINKKKKKNKYNKNKIRNKISKKVNN